jgi:soluble lytic murein transglycosylase
MRWLPIMLTVFVLGMTGYFVIPFRHDVADPHCFDDLFKEAGVRYEVHPALVKAVAWQESRLDAGAKGGVGELGLMQLTDMASFEWADAEGITSFQPGHLIHPKTNTLAGAFYLSKMLRRYQEKDQPLVYALADYNAGRKVVLEWMADEGATNSNVFLQQMDYPGTQKYIRSVIKYFEDFQNDFEPILPAEPVIDFENLASIHSAENPPSSSIE